MKICFAFSLVLLLVFTVCSLTIVGEDLQVSYPEGYRSWTDVRSMIIEPGHPLENPFQGIHHIYGNEKAIAGYKDDRYDDGAVIVFDLLNYDQADNTIQESGRKLIADLFHRLNVVPIREPSLRDRKSDIPLLVKHFIAQYSKMLGKNISKVSAGSMKKLMSYSWPGNIRELQNVLERNVVLSQQLVLNIEDQFIDNADMHDDKSVIKLENIERDHIIKVLQKSHWQVHGRKVAATKLDINTSTLRARMKKLGISKPKDISY